MKTFDLSFGTVTLLRPDLTEVIVNEGVEMDLDMVDEYHMFISEFLADPCATLINKLHQYTYTFEAQMSLSTLDKIKAIAIVVYTETARITTTNLLKLPTHAGQNVKIFSDREAGLRWLEQQLALFKELPTISPAPGAP